MRDKLFALLSVVVLALAIATPSTAQFASNDKSFRLKESPVSGSSVPTPASGSAAIFKESTHGALMVKNSSGVVLGAMGNLPISSLAATTVLTEAYAGRIIVFDGAASQTLTLPEITASNIGMQFVIINADSTATPDTVAALCNANDSLLPVSGTIDADDSITLGYGDVFRVTAITDAIWQLELEA